MKTKTMFKLDFTQLLIGLLLFAVLAKMACNKEVSQRQLEPASIVTHEK